ncbi:ABC transporter ATP-binding protein [Listeria floridensis FSL S10-1187]|uniref:Putative hemin import ATP-binding protein HrtA n=1 Tax=Listeria floridensis FSL S10-1187 TaxID=1265817 RepID=A0ABN0RED8_9LIST|nr:ABC transporter ATP-binding protein [Listeria floridensis]EUJ30989.1 ABC transporter ATP-binding protein [Listeria floridensis FSL S10-1187]
MENPKLQLKNVSKFYHDGEATIEVLKDVNLEVNQGEFVAIVGPSGAGKSTFLSIAGALLTPSAGEVFVDGEAVTNLSKKKLTERRLNQIGFIFQGANLVPYLTVFDQLMVLPVLGGNRSGGKTFANQLLGELGLAQRKNQYPDRLSGGERQRVAIARALMNDPAIILADEPTASLDSERGRKVVEMIATEVKRKNKAAIMVTHDERVLDLCDRVVKIEDGRLIEAR